MDWDCVSLVIHRFSLVCDSSLHVYLNHPWSVIECPCAVIFVYSLRTVYFHSYYALNTSSLPLYIYFLNYLIVSLFNYRQIKVHDICFFWMCQYRDGKFIIWPKIPISFSVLCVWKQIVIKPNSVRIRFLYGAAVYQWCEFKSRRGKNKLLTALKSNANTVWLNFQTYIYVWKLNQTVLELDLYIYI